MGLFDWLFGKKKTEQQPKQPETEPQIDTQTFESEEGAFGIGTITFSEGGNIVIGGMQPDGSSTISSGGQSMTFNQPKQEIDDGKRSTDPLKVAHQLLSHYKKAPLDQYEDMLFLEALWLALEANQTLPNFKKTCRQHLVKLTRFALAGDHISAFELVRTTQSEPWSKWLQRNIEPLFVRSHPIETARFLIEIKHYPNLQLIQAVASVDPELALLLVDIEPDEKWRTSLLGNALLDAMDAGQEITQLERRWQELVSDPWAQPLNKVWLNLETRRLARLEVEPALKFQDEVSYQFGLSEETQKDFFRQIALKMPEKALDLAAPEGSEIYDVLSGLIGCHLAGLDIGLKLEHFFENLTEYAYRPHSAMGWLLKAGILRGDAAYCEKVLTKGGPKGWQTAYFAGPYLSELASSEPAAAQELLPILMHPRKPGFVAGRDASASLVAGTAMRLPQFLAFSKPKPIESLVLYTALGNRGPQWDKIP